MKVDKSIEKLVSGIVGSEEMASAQKCIMVCVKDISTRNKNAKKMEKFLFV